MLGMAVWRLGWSVCGWEGGLVIYILVGEFQDHDLSLWRHFKKQPTRGIHTEVDEQQILVQTIHDYCTPVCAVSFFPTPYQWTSSWVKGGWDREWEEGNRSTWKLRLIYITAAAAAAKSFQSCPTLCDPMDCSPPGSSIHGIFQARVLEWGAIVFSGHTSLHIFKTQNPKYWRILFYPHFKSWESLQLIALTSTLTPIKPFLRRSSEKESLTQAMFWNTFNHDLHIM